MASIERPISDFFRPNDWHLSPLWLSETLSSTRFVRYEGFPYRVGGSLCNVGTGPVSTPVRGIGFCSNAEVADAGTLAVLLESTASIILSAILVSHLAVYYRQVRELRAHAIERRVG